MVRVNYNAILQAYESINTEIDTEFGDWGIATEASTEDMLQGTVTNGNDQTNSNDSAKADSINPAAKSKFVQALKRIIEKIGNLIEMAKRKINNNMKLMWQTDRGFRSALLNAQKTTQPLKGFNALTYQYNEGYLERTLQSLMQGFMTEFDRIGNTNLIGEDAEADSIDYETCLKNVFSKVTSDQDIQTVEAMTREMVDKYRGEKQEMTFSQSQIPALQQIVAKGSSSSAFQNYMDPIEKRYNNLKAKASRFQQVNSNADMKRVSSLMNCTTKLYNAALTFSKVYYELKVERYLSAREALKKFYNLS